MAEEKEISILGSGPAGLAYAYYAQKAGKKIWVYEKNNIVGGNCITTYKEGYCWDSGAHRIHNVYKEVTDEIKLLLGEELKPVNAPSHIYFNEKFLPFPFNIVNVIGTFGIAAFLRATREVLFKKKKPAPKNFKEYAVGKYGLTLAQPLLLNYTEKLWGISTEKLSTQVTGKRLNGLTPWQWLLESVFKNAKKGKHLEGSFLYPDKGIGLLSQKMAEKIGDENIKTNSAITAIFHTEKTITDIEINNTQKIKVEKVISTLPLPLFAKLCTPALPNNILEMAHKMRFRNLILVAFAINKPSVSSSASIYFPGQEIFTRVVEPRNRSPFMSPENKTSLVAEIPCFKEDEIWKKSDAEIIQTTMHDLLKTGLCDKEEITNAWVQKVPFAYPVLSCDAVKNLNELKGFFSVFKNLTIAGRNGNFSYTHVHDLFEEARVFDWDSN